MLSAATRSLAALVVLGACSPDPLPPENPSPPPSTEVEVQRSSGPVTVTLECVRGPVPPPPGQSPERDRRLEILGDDAPVRRTIRRLDGSEDVTNVRTEPGTIERVRELAADALAEVGEVSESPRPDGTMCTLQVTGGTTATWRVAWPTSHDALRPLLEQLMSMIEG